MRLVCLCARPKFGKVQEDRLHELLENRLDWDTVLGAASTHGVSGMLYHHLANHAVGRVPAEILESLQQRARGVQLYNLGVMTELIRVATLFQAHEIPLLTYKGPSMAQRYYGNLAFRRFGDVDLLLHRTDIERATDLLTTDGYAPLRRLTDGQEKHWHDDQLGFELYHEERKVLLELHWALLNRTLTFRLPLHDVWMRAEEVSMGTARVHVLAPEDLLLYLCAHGTKHHWSRLLWVCDVAQVLRHQPDADWKGIVQRAESIGSLRTLLLGVALAARWLDAPLSVELRSRIAQDEMVGRLITDIEARWFGTKERDLRPASWASFWFEARTRQRLRDNAALLLHYARLTVTPSEQDRAVLPLPTALRALYYLVRPVRLASTAARRLLSALSRVPTKSFSYANQQDSTTSSSRSTTR